MLTLYSGNCRRKKQAKTSSQWKVPLWVPIFFTVILSERSLFASLDMYRGPKRVSVTAWKQQHDASGRRSPEKLLAVFISTENVFLINVDAFAHRRHIQSIKTWAASEANTLSGRTGYGTYYLGAGVHRGILHTDTGDAQTKKISQKNKNNTKHLTLFCNISLY